MRQVSSNIAGAMPQISGTIREQGGTTTTFTNADIVANTLSYKGGTSVPSEFTVGAAVIGALSFSLMNDTNRFSSIVWYDSTITLSMTFGNDTVNYGKFWVVNHHEIGNQVRVECYDALKILDEYEMHEVTSGMTFPTTVSGVVNAIVSFLSTRVGETFTVTGLQNGTLPVAEIKNERMTMRACISYLAQMTGQFVRAISNELRFGWYNKSTPQYSAGMTFSHDLRTSNDTIGGCTVSDYDETTSQTYGSGYLLEIGDNPFITADNIQAVTNAIGAAVAGISYRPGDVSIKSNAAIEPGDHILVNTGQENGVHILATSITYKPQLQQAITADAEPYAGDLRISRSAYIKRQAQQAAKDEISDELDDPTSDLNDAISKAAAEWIRITSNYQDTFLGSPNDSGFVMRRGSGGVAETFLCTVTGWTVYSAGCRAVVPVYDATMANNDIVMTFPCQLSIEFYDTNGAQTATVTGYVSLQARRYAVDAFNIIGYSMVSGSNKVGGAGQATTITAIVYPSFPATFPQLVQIASGDWEWDVV